MDKLSKLKREAMQSCNYRGHSMKRFVNGNYSNSVSVCKVCGMGVWVLDKPLPNETQISGLAVAINCKQESI